MIVTLMALLIAAEASPTAAPDVQKASADARKICRTHAETGSFIRKTKVCRTRAEWNRADELQRDEARSRQLLLSTERGN